MTKIKRVRPPAKTPLMISGGVTILAAAGIYGYTFATNAEFEKAGSTQQMRIIQKKNNSLIISSAVFFSVGAGLEYAGIMIDGGPGFAIRGRW